MLSLAIKNTILMVLIILIFHFLIKNYLLEQDYVPTQKKTADAPIQTAPEVKLESVTTNPAVEKAVTPVIEKLTDSKPMPIKSNLTTSADDELLKFVFGQEDTATVPVESKPSFKKSTPLSQLPTGAPSSSSNPDVDNGGASFTVIKQYENENIMNGGDLFKGIQGYSLGAEDAFSSLDAFFEPMKN